MVFQGKLLRGGFGNGERDEEFNAKAQRDQRRKEPLEEEGAPIGMRLWSVGKTRNSTRRPKGSYGAKKPRKRKARRLVCGYGLWARRGIQRGDPKDAMAQRNSRGHRMGAGIL